MQFKGACYDSNATYIKYVPYILVSAGPALLEGRAKLIEKDNGTRAKLLAMDGNEIDSMFVDRRGTDNRHGKKLVSILQSWKNHISRECYQNIPPT